MIMRVQRWMRMNLIFKAKLNKNWIEFKKSSKVSRDNLIESIGMMMMEVSLKELLIHNMLKNEHLKLNLINTTFDFIFY
jgi:hypothetical protein